MFVEIYHEDAGTSYKENLTVKIKRTPNSQRKEKFKVRFEIKSHFAVLI